MTVSIVKLKNELMKMGHMRVFYSRTPSLPVNWLTNTPANMTTIGSSLEDWCRSSSIGDTNMAPLFVASS